MYKSLKIIMNACVMLQSTLAGASDWGVVVRVNNVEASYIPSSLPFTIDAPAGTCAAGSLLFWNIRGSNATEKAANT